MMKAELPYPFKIEFMKRNKAFLFFCPPDCLDEQGRPVLEGRSIQYKPDLAAYQQCLYPDSRSNACKLINVDSLRALMQNHEGVIAFVDDIARYIRNHAIALSGSTDLATLHVISFIGYKSPQIFFINKILGDTVEVPAVCAVASRFFHGLVNVLALMALDHDGYLEGRELTAEDIYLYADRNMHLIGKSESCAASSAMIIKYVNAVRQSCCSSHAGNLPERYSGILPDNTVDEICHAARVTAELELCCLIYEAVRCTLWRQIPAYRIGEEPLPAFATPHCLVARKISLAEKPFEHLLFRRAYHLARPLLINPSHVDEMLSLAVELANNSLETRPDEARRRIKAAVLELLDEHADFLNQHVKPGACISADLDVFFGRWPGI